jgi:glycerol-3-phosphate cytidylyltransferase-like family protein
MIVETSELADLKRAVVMVDGGFDPLHRGHIEYFAAAAGLGLPVLCNVSGDEYVATKHPPLLKDVDRVQVIDAIRYISYTHLSHTSTAHVLGLLEPTHYVKGSDWRGRLPEEERELCARLGIEVVFTDTVLDSSSRILDAFQRGDR